MHADRFGGGDNGVNGGFGFEAGDIFGDRAGEQFDILGQIADVTAEQVGRS